MAIIDPTATGNWPQRPDFLVLSMRDTVGPGWLVAHALTRKGKAALPAILDALPDAISYPSVLGSSHCPELPPTKGGVLYRTDGSTLFRVCAERDVCIRTLVEKPGRKEVTA